MSEQVYRDALLKAKMRLLFAAGYIRGDDPEEAAVCQAEADAIEAVLAAPAQPLTADEVREFAKRVDGLDGIVLRGEKCRLQNSLANFASILDHLEEWRRDNAPAYHTPATPEDATQT